MATVELPPKFDGDPGQIPPTTEQVASHSISVGTSHPAVALDQDRELRAALQPAVAVTPQLSVRSARRQRSSHLRRGAPEGSVRNALKPFAPRLTATSVASQPVPISRSVPAGAGGRL
jgi:hypothetical protein